MSTTTNTSRMLTVKEVSQLLGLSLSLVYREISTGRLRSHCFGKRSIRVSQEDLEAYLAAARQDNRRVETPVMESKRSLSVGNGFKHVSVSRLLSSQS